MSYHQILKKSVDRTCFRKLLKQFINAFSFDSTQTKIRIFQVTRTVNKDLDMITTGHHVTCQTNEKSW